MNKSLFKAEIETTETWVIKRPRRFIRNWCRQCNREVSLLIPEEAARLTCMEMNSFYLLFEQNLFHIYYLGTKRQPYICLNSLCCI